MLNEFFRLALAVKVHSINIKPDMLFENSQEVVNLISTSAADCYSIEVIQPALELETVSQISVRDLKELISSLT
jgi:hypothetical protein